MRITNERNQYHTKVGELPEVGDVYFILIILAISLFIMWHVISSFIVKNLLTRCGPVLYICKRYTI